MLKCRNDQPACLDEQALLFARQAGAQVTANGTCAPSVARPGSNGAIMRAGHQAGFLPSAADKRPASPLATGPLCCKLVGGLAVFPGGPSERF